MIQPLLVKIVWEKQTPKKKKKLRERDKVTIYVHVLDLCHVNSNNSNKFNPNLTWIMIELYQVNLSNLFNNFN